jgi:hypothetical protein
MFSNLSASPWKYHNSQIAKNSNNNNSPTPKATAFYQLIFQWDLPQLFVEYGLNDETKSYLYPQISPYPVVNGPHY